MSAIELVQIERSALEDLLYRVSKRAAADALAELAERDEMLNIAEICERTGMSRHTFGIPIAVARLLRVSYNTQRLPDAYGSNPTTRLAHRPPVPEPAFRH